MVVGWWAGGGGVVALVLRLRVFEGPPIDIDCLIVLFDCGLSGQTSEQVTTGLTQPDWLPPTGFWQSASQPGQLILLMPAELWV